MTTCSSSATSSSRSTASATPTSTSSARAGRRSPPAAASRRSRRTSAAAGRSSTRSTRRSRRGSGPDFVALREGRAPAADAPRAPLVELLLTDQAGWDAGGEDAVDLGELPRTQAWRQAEARLLAQRVRDLVDDGDARPEEIVVLLRGLGDLPVYERALEDQGLLTLSVGGRGYWGRQVVRDLCAWLAALANPRDEAALYGVLASPLVGVSSDALAHVARAGRGNAWRAIGEAFEQDARRFRRRLRPAAPPESRRERSRRRDRRRGARAGGAAARPRRPAARRRPRAPARVRRALRRERALAPRLGLDELLRRAVDSTGYDLHVLSLSGGARRLANIHKLLRLAAAYERDHGRDVRGLADLATAELEAEARETDAPVELGDVKAVRLMSIHAAKGLEFETVCVADLGRRRPGEDADLLVAGDDVGLRLVGLDGTNEKALAYERLLERARERAAREEDRVLYVAATRARDRLILSGGVALDPWPKEGPGAAPLSWLGPALLGGDLGRLPTAQQPIRDVTWSDGAHTATLRCVLNRPDTIGRVLRASSLAPAGATLPLAPRAASPAPPAQPEPRARPRAGGPDAVVLVAVGLAGVRLSPLPHAGARAARGAGDPRRRGRRGRADAGSARARVARPRAARAARPGRRAGRRRRGRPRDRR